MERRSLLGRIFGSEKNTTAPSTSEQIEILEGRKAVFTPYKGDFHEDPDVLACVDTIARNGAKMHPRHIRNFNGEFQDVAYFEPFYLKEFVATVAKNKVL